MKKSFLTYTISAILLIVGQVNLNAIIFLKRAGFYLAGSGSWAWYVTPEGRLEVSTASPVLKTGPYRPKSNANANASIGYYLDQWRLEIEANYHDKQTNRPFRHGGVSVTDFGFVPKFSAMGNAYYDIPLIPYWGFYLGAGAGFGLRETAITGLINCSKRDGAFAFQVMAGTFYDLSQCLTVTLGYRVYGITRPEELKFFTAVGTPEATTIIVSARRTPLAQSVELGLRWGFGLW